MTWHDMQAPVLVGLIAYIIATTASRDDRPEPLTKTVEFHHIYLVEKYEDPAPAFTNAAMPGDAELLEMLERAQK